jgi:hypothetical protein
MTGRFKSFVGDTHADSPILDVLKTADRDFGRYKSNCIAMVDAASLASSARYGGCQ